VNRSVFFGTGRYPMWGGATGRKAYVLCSDGRVRVATMTAEADTYFSVPARVSVNGRTVGGSLFSIGEPGDVSHDGYDAPADIRYAFTATSKRRQAAVR